MSLFDNFDVKVPTNLNEANIIGVDFGDGDLCASRVEKIGDQFVISYLYADEARVQIKVANILQVDIKTKKPLHLGFPGKPKDCFCACNFKKIPGSTLTKTNAIKESTVSLTNSECMQYAFNLFINNLFQYNALKKDKRSILLIGRPSSNEWRKKEKDYVALLKEQLKIEDYSQPVDIVIVSESLAALARATKPDEAQRIRPQENAIVVDCGSSTFDMTVVRQGSIPEGGEYSRQFGAGKIEELMLKQFLDEHPEKKPVFSKAHSKIFLRKRKEEFYGPGTEPGCNENSFTVRFENQPKPIRVNKDIDDEFMEQTLEKTGPVTIEASMEGIDQEEYASWHEACLAVFKEAKQQVKKCLKGEKLHKIVLTGGASVMPEISANLGEIFGKGKIIHAKFPNYTVAEGLAYVGLVEVLKHEQCMILKHKIDDIIEDTPSIDDIVESNCSEKIWDQIMSTLCEWVNSERNTSFNHWEHEFNDLKKRQFREIVCSEILKWYHRTNIVKKINMSISENFKNLFPDFSGNFYFELPKNIIDDILTIDDINIKFDITSLFGNRFQRYANFFGLFDANLSKSRTEDERKIFLCRASERKDEFKDIIRNALENLPYLDTIKSRLKLEIWPYIVNHVESMTPYFNMSKTHSADSSI